MILRDSDGNELSASDRQSVSICRNCCLISLPTHHTGTSARSIGLGDNWMLDGRPIEFDDSVNEHSIRHTDN